MILKEQYFYVIGEEQHYGNTEYDSTTLYLL